MNQSLTEVNLPVDSTQNSLVPFSEFIDELKVKMKLVFHTRANIDKLSIKRGLPPFALREIMSVNPLSVGIPKQYGGRGGIMHENIGLLAAASYESLALSLTFRHQLCAVFATCWQIWPRRSKKGSVSNVFSKIKQWAV
ncbi:hypothetical protein MASR2M47_25300 [Draconibacterium sp.]